MRITGIAAIALAVACRGSSTPPPPAQPPSPLTMSGTSESVTWQCLSGEAGLCPWGDRLTNQAVAWPAEVFPFSWRLGYQASYAVYLDASQARGISVTIVSGRASILSGQLDQREPFAALAALEAGQTFRVVSLADGVVLSIESQGDAFTFTTRAAP